MDYLALSAAEQTTIARNRLARLEATAFETELVILEVQAVIDAGLQPEVHTEALAGHQLELVKLRTQISALTNLLTELTVGVPS